MYYGRGAGKLPTASAVVSDVVDCAKHGRTHIISLWEDEEQPLSDIGDSVRRFFVRVKEDGAAQVAELFGQVERVDAGVPGEFGFITSRMTERDFAGKAAALEGFLGRIRVE